MTKEEQILDNIFNKYDEYMLEDSFHKKIVETMLFEAVRMAINERNELLKECIETLTNMSFDPEDYMDIVKLIDKLKFATTEKTHYKIIAKYSISLEHPTKEVYLNYWGETNELSSIIAASMLREEIITDVIQTAVLKYEEVMKLKIK